MVLRKVSSKKDIQLFHRVPWVIYKDDDNWIPHLKQDIEAKFERKKNKYYDGTNAVRWILFDNDGNLIGRIAAFVHPKTAYTQKQPTGGIGFFECINDQKAADRLFDTAVDWLKGKGMEAADGPINFGERDQFWGLLIKNFTSPPTYGMNYNPEYYVELFENYGFKIYFKQFMYHRSMYVPAQDVFVRKAERIRKDEKFYCESVRGKSIEQIANDFLIVYNKAWGRAHKDFKEMSPEQAYKIMKSMDPVKDEDITIFAYYDGDPVGFYINLPELNQIFKHVHGNLNWIGKLIFLYHMWRKTPTTMYGLVFGVVPEWQNKGVEGAMIKYAEEYVVPLNRYHDTVLTWIGDFNQKMLKVCENLNAEQYRTFATYRLLFDPKAKFERAPLI